MVDLGLYHLRQVFRVGVSLIAVAAIFPPAPPEFGKSLVVVAPEESRFDF